MKANVILLMIQYYDERNIIINSNINVYESNVIFNTMKRNIIQW